MGRKVEDSFHDIGVGIHGGWASYVGTKTLSNDWLSSKNWYWIIFIVDDAGFKKDAY